MLELEENLKILNSLIVKLQTLKETLAISSLEDELNILKEKTLEDGFWNNIENSNKICAKIKSLERKIGNFKSIESNLDNLIQLNKLILEEFDEDLSKDLLKQTNEFTQKIEKLELETLLSGKYDTNNAIITLHPGAGGTESQDWAQMLYRMYSKWASSNGFEIKELKWTGFLFSS